MAKRATANDAQVIMQLYDLRREAEMRKARSWFLTEFWPHSVEDFMKIANAFPSQENSWLRQVGSYWDMAAAMVLHGAINEDLFLQPGISGEMFFVFAKVHPFLKELREKMNNPNAWRNIEQVATRSKTARKQLDRFLKTVEQRRKAMTKSAKAS
jgi:hypothetical protein